MVLPIYKVLSLVIRVFSKPLVTYTKQAHLKNGATTHPHLRKSFIYLGNTYNKAETWINRKFMKIQTQFAYKPLNDELALQKGIQFFYEIIFYSIVIGLPLYQMMRGANQAKAKSIALQQKLKKMDDNLQRIMAREQRLIEIQNERLKNKQANDTPELLKLQKKEIKQAPIQRKIQQQYQREANIQKARQEIQRPKIVIDMNKIAHHQAINIKFPDNQTHRIHLYYSNNIVQPKAI